MHFLIESREFFGVNAPVLLWLAAVGILAAALISAFKLSWRVRSIRRAERTLSTKLRKLPTQMAGRGLSLLQLEDLKKQFQGVESLEKCWIQLQGKVVRRRGTNNEDEYWLSALPSDVLTPSVITDRYINREFYQAIPGILTGTGLLFTFVAILFALLHVRLVGNRVEGMALLIEGLSGKFVSSIAALLAATLFVVLEKDQMHRLDRSSRDLADVVTAVVPVLTPTHLLIDLHNDIGEQSIAFRTFNADLSGRLKQSFSESMGPTLEKMVKAVEDLNTLLRTAEAEKSNTITDNLAGMISRLEASMTAALSNMGEQFTSSLSGSTMAQFSRLSESLAGAASVLERMNEQNQATQSALTELVSFAKNSTAEQMALGRSQVEDLTNVLRSMLVQIEQTTGSSVNNMGAALAALMSDLSSRVNDLTEQTRAKMLQSSQASADAANSVLKEARDWTTASTEQLATLIEKHTAQLNTADQLQTALSDAASRFTAAGSQFNSIITNLQRIANETSASTTALSGAAKSVRDSQEGFQRVATLSSTQAEKLSQASAETQHLLVRISQTMQQYETTFNKVEGAASQLLQTLERNLAQHLELCRKGYESLVKVSDEHFASATQRLGSTINELEEYLQDLTELIGNKAVAKGANVSR